MLDFNVMLLLTVMTRLSKLIMSIDDVKAVLEKTMPLMPDDVRNFFQQSYGEKMRMMGREQAAALCSKPSNSVLLQRPEEEVYPTESRIKQKAKHAAEKEITGEKHKPKKKLVHIEPGYDDCGEDDSSILEDTGDVYWVGDIPSLPIRRHKQAKRIMKAFLAEFEGEYNPSNRLFGSEVYGCFPTDVHRKVEDMDSFLSETCRDTKGGYTDVFEQCGGSARVSIILVTRRHITKGPNFDIIA